MSGPDTSEGASTQRSAIRCDESTWPVVLFVFDGRQTSADIEAYLDALGRFYARRHPFACVTVMRDFVTDRALLGRIGRWMKEHDAEVREYFAGGALVSTSAAFRFLLTSFYLIQRPHYPYTVVESLHDAVPWVRDRLADRGLTPPAAAELLSTLESSEALPKE